jgi:ABC-type dipeptide/oligopeptide/nickel transport system permease component
VSLGSFIVRRLATSAVAVLGVCVLVFAFLHLTPGDPVDQLSGGEATPDQRREIARCMNLESSLVLTAALPAGRRIELERTLDFARPKLEQFGLFLANVADLSLGHQCPNPEDKPTVMDRILEVLPYTIELAFGGMLVAIIFALPLGIVAAVRRGTWVDAFAAIVSLSGISMPVMWMGPLLIGFFFVNLGWLPGPGDPGAPLALLLPSVVIGTHYMALLARMTRSSLVEVLDEDFIRTARAKGLPGRTVLLKHALRNALIPVITVAGLQFGSMLAGAIITEKIFARPGVGTLLLEGISERNFPLIQGTVLFVAVVYVSVNVVVDITYGLVDPRVRIRS